MKSTLTIQINMSNHQLKISDKMSTTIDSQRRLLGDALVNAAQELVLDNGWKLHINRRDESDYRFLVFGGTPYLYVGEEMKGEKLLGIIPITKKMEILTAVEMFYGTASGRRVMNITISDARAESVVTRYVERLERELPAIEIHMTKRSGKTLYIKSQISQF